MHNFSDDNLENNIYALILDCNKLQSGLLSEYIFYNIDGIYHHLILKLIFAIYNLANNNIEETTFLIVDNTNGHFIYLDDWQNEYYFIRPFPILFLYRDDGYLTKCKTIILLQV